jgi:hypothetical protein
MGKTDEIRRIAVRNLPDGKGMIEQAYVLTY